MKMQSQEDTEVVEEVRRTFCIDFILRSFLSIDSSCRVVYRKNCHVASQRALQSQGGFESAVRVKQQTKSVLRSMAAGHDKSHVRTRPW